MLIFASSPRRQSQALLRDTAMDIGEDTTETYIIIYEFDRQMCAI
jgi:hypothetical protein